MAIIDYSNPAPELGHLGCGYAASQYAEAKGALPALEEQLASAVSALESLLGTAAGLYHTACLGPSAPFRECARQTLDRLHAVNAAVTRFVDDVQSNILLGMAHTTRRPESFFISYARSDQTIAARLAADLRRCGQTVWRDEESIRLGESIRAAIERGIEDSRFLIHLVSDASSQSKWCERELDMALSKEGDSRTVVLPVVLGESAVPPLLRTKRYLVLKDYERDFKQLLELLPV